MKEEAIREDNNGLISIHTILDSPESRKRQWHLLPLPKVWRGTPIF